VRAVLATCPICHTSVFGDFQPIPITFGKNYERRSGVCGQPLLARGHGGKGSRGRAVPAPSGPVKASQSPDEFAIYDLRAQSADDGFVVFECACAGDIPAGHRPALRGRQTGSNQIKVNQGKQNPSGRALGQKSRTRMRRIGKEVGGNSRAGRPRSVTWGCKPPLRNRKAPSVLEIPGW
jgi:hypothetical protein